MQLKRKHLAVMILIGAASLASPSVSRAGLIGPNAYLSFNDSPFKGTSFSYFYLEDFEDSLLNTPGVSVDHGTVSGQGVYAVDSVDGDNSPIDGSGSNGSSIYHTASMTYTFDANVLGGLPTHAGLVFTDGTPNGRITFEAFDQNGVSLGKVTERLGDNSFFGETAEDRFFGATNAGGISRILISDNGSVNNLEMDHLQYGLVGPAQAVPEPTTIVSAGLGLLGLVACGRRRRNKAA